MISEYTKHYWKSIQQPPGKHLEREERFPFTSGWLLKKSEIFIHLSYSLDSFSHLNIAKFQVALVDQVMVMVYQEEGRKVLGRMHLG